MLSKAQKVAKNQTFYLQGGIKYAAQTLFSQEPKVEILEMLMCSGNVGRTPYYVRF